MQDLTNYTSQVLQHANQLMLHNMGGGGGGGGGGEPTNKQTKKENIIWNAWFN